MCRLGAGLLSAPRMPLYGSDDQESHTRYVRHKGLNRGAENASQEMMVS